MPDPAVTRSGATRLRLRIKVAPKAAKNEVVGWMGDTLRLRVSAPPTRGKANAAVLELMSVALGVTRAQLRLVAGATSERKIVEIEGLTATELRTRIEFAPARKR